MTNWIRSECLVPRGTQRIFSTSPHDLTGDGEQQKAIVIECSDTRPAKRLLDLLTKTAITLLEPLFHVERGLDDGLSFLVVTQRGPPIVPSVVMPLVLERHVNVGIRIREAAAVFDYQVDHASLRLLRQGGLDVVERSNRVAGACGAGI